MRRSKVNVLGLSGDAPQIHDRLQRELPVHVELLFLATIAHGSSDVRDDHISQIRKTIPDESVAQIRVAAPPLVLETRRSRLGLAQQMRHESNVRASHKGARN